MTWNIVPVDDLVEHEMGEACVCGPKPNLLTEGDGDEWMYVHNSLDGRERNE